MKNKGKYKKSEEAFIYIDVERNDHLCIGWLSGEHEGCGCPTIRNPGTGSTVTNEA